MIVTAIKKEKKEREFVGNENMNFKKILIYNRHVPAAILKFYIWCMQYFIYSNSPFYLHN